MTGGSWRSVPYELRPRKQIERRMIVDALMRLSACGFAIRDYQYTGMGSVFFVDFILFHKIVGIRKMLSVEASEDIRRRIEYNIPYAIVKTHIGPASEVIPTLDPKLKHLLWLDYDGPIDHLVLDDLRSASTYLARGSIILVTVDLTPSELLNNADQWEEHFLEFAEYLLPVPTSDENIFGASQLPTTNALVLENTIKESTAARTCEFHPLFNFLYSDGHKMLTLGGMIVGSPEKDRLADLDLTEATYFRFKADDQPYKIDLPNITRKERLYLDQNMPCPDGWVPDAFEMDVDAVRLYREIYRFFPPYAELAL